MAGFILVSAAFVAAEHEVYDRYVALGGAKDAGGQPIPGRTVELIPSGRLGTRSAVRFDPGNHVDDRNSFRPTLARVLGR